MASERLMTFDLRCWCEADRDAFARMHADPVVMADLGGPYDRAASDAKFDRYRDGWAIDGISRWAIIDEAGQFLGYVGITKRDDATHPLARHHEIGWRLCRHAWGRGVATLAARRALVHAWSVLTTHEILAYTAADNRRSRGVMHRLGLTRTAARDFTAVYPRGIWSGLTWVAERPVAAATGRISVPPVIL